MACRREIGGTRFSANAVPEHVPHLTQFSVPRSVAKRVPLSAAISVPQIVANLVPFLVSILVPRLVPYLVPPRTLRLAAPGIHVALRRPCVVLGALKDLMAPRQLGGRGSCGPLASHRDGAWGHGPMPPAPVRPSSR